MTIKQDLSKASVDAEVEMFVIDGTKIGMPTPLYLTGSTTQDGQANISFGGLVFTPCPIMSKGWGSNQNGAPARPSLIISNVNKFILPFIQEYKDLVGAKVTRLRTLAKYLDGQPGADFGQRFPDQEFWIEQKSSHNSDSIEWILASVLDMPNVKIPRRQMLRESSRGVEGFPGISRIRLR